MSWAERNLQADEAVRHFGTNAIPTLLRMLQSTDPPLKARLIELGERRRWTAAYRIPRSKVVAASWISSTNGNAVVQLTNASAATFRVVDCRIHSRGSPNDP